MKHARGQRLRKEISQVLRGGNEGNTDDVVLDQFTHVEVAASNVLRLLMVLRVVREVYGSLVIHVPSAT